MEDINQREYIVNELKFKVAFVGNPGVGKSSIIRRCVRNEFQDARDPTTRVIESRCVIRVQNNLEIILEIWDAPGEIYPIEFRQDFYRNVDAIVLTYDVTNENSFIFIKQKLRELCSQCNRPIKEIALFIVGNKSDLPIMELAVDLNEVKIFCEQNQAVSVVTSAIAGSNMRFLFETIAIKTNTYFNRFHKPNAPCIVS